LSYCLPINQAMDTANKDWIVCICNSSCKKKIWMSEKIIVMLIKVILPVVFIKASSSVIVIQVALDRK